MAESEATAVGGSVAGSEFELKVLRAQFSVGVGY